MRILVLGLACSGKSTFAQQLAKHTSLPVYHLDRLIWKKNWVKENTDTFFAYQQSILNKKSWIYEGYNKESFSIQIHAADIIIYIKASRLRRTVNWLKRLLKYSKVSRPDMTDGNIEKFSVNYIKWLWRYDDEDTLPLIYQYASSKEVIVLNNRTEQSLYLASLKTAG